MSSLKLNQIPNRTITNFYYHNLIANHEYTSFSYCIINRNGIIIFFKVLAALKRAFLTNFQIYLVDDSRTPWFVANTGKQWWGTTTLVSFCRFCWLSLLISHTLHPVFYCDVFFCEFHQAPTIHRCYLESSFEGTPFVSEMRTAFGKLSSRWQRMFL